MKFCVSCREFKWIDQFHNKNFSCRLCKKLKAIGNRKNDPNYYKNQRRSYKKRTKLKRMIKQIKKGKDRRLKDTYGISLKEYEIILKNQKGVCAICKNPEDRIHKKYNAPMDLSVDHNHKTGKIRGLLCTRCNTALGMLRDDPGIIDNALTYIVEDGIL